MSLTLVNTEKLTPLSNVKKKSGMSLIEVMAALVILSILFSAISSLIINNLKFEEKSNVKIDNYTFMSIVTDLFETNTGGVINEDITDGFKYYICDEIFKNKYENRKVYINFDNSDEMKNLLKNGIVNEYISAEEIHESENVYELRIETKPVKSNSKETQISSLYNINIKLIDKIYNDEINKNLYISRVNKREPKGENK